MAHLGGDIGCGSLSLRGLLIRDWKWSKARLGARCKFEGVGSLGSGLHRERKWIQLVHDRRYRSADTRWARLREGWLIPEEGECSLRRRWRVVRS
jgi:hypothetical protein